MLVCGTQGKFDFFFLGSAFVDYLVDYCFAFIHRWGNRYTKGDRSLGTVREDLLKRYVWWFNCMIVLVNVLITVLCSLDTENFAVPVFAVCILLPVLLQFSGGVLYMYLVAPLKSIFGSRKDKDEKYNALFEERFNARSKKKTNNVRSSLAEAPPGPRKNSTQGGRTFIRRATSLENKKSTANVATEIIEEEIDSDEEAELQKQFQQTLLADLSKGSVNTSTTLDAVRAKLGSEGIVNGSGGRPGFNHSNSLGRVELPNQGHKGRRSPPS